MVKPTVKESNLTRPSKLRCTGTILVSPEKLSHIHTRKLFKRSSSPHLLVDIMRKNLNERIYQ